MFYYQLIYNLLSFFWQATIQNKETNQLLQVNQELVWYNASDGNNNLSRQASG